MTLRRPVKASETAVIFDADGVLLRCPPWTESMRKSYGFDDRRLSSIFQTCFQGCLRGHNDLRDELLRILPDAGWGKSVDDFLDYWFQAESKLDEVLLREVSALRKRGFWLGMATNQERYRFQFMRARMRLGSYFDALFASCEVGYAKPQAEFFDAVSRKLDAAGIRHTIFFDDKPENVRAALECGWEAYLYRSIVDFWQWNRHAGEL